MSRIGANVGRQIIGGWAANQIGEEIRLVRTRGETPTLQRAVVLDVIMDPGLLSNDKIELIRNTVNNPQFADIMPVNSVIVRMTSDAQGNTARTNTILFPFFSSHIQLPVQPGEIVHVIYEDFFGSGQTVGFWLTRVSSERTIEDPNYTHYDRRFDVTMNPVNYSTSERSRRNSEQPGPGFQNGGNTTDTFTLVPTSSMDRPYESIIRDAFAYRDNQDSPPVVTPEPVPRWRKRPQELVLQGSNNALICLGEDRRAGPLGALEPESGAPDAKGQAGTIDIVAGRGRFPPQSDNDTPRETSARVITNIRGDRETDKAAYRRNITANRLGDNPREGDPDFKNDAARLYVTMQSNADDNFAVTNIEYTADTLHPSQPQDAKGEAVVRGVKTISSNKSYIVGKADHVRLIAREDDENGIEGTLLFLREGQSEEDLGYIFVTKDGIQVEAPKIYLGRGNRDNPSSTHFGELGGPGGEPYIRWSKFKETVDSLHEEINILRQHVESQIQQFNTTQTVLHNALLTAAASSICIPMSPDPGVLAMQAALSVNAGIIQNSIQPDRSTLESRLPNQQRNTNEKVQESKSEKIFGE